MSGELIGILGVGVALAGLILTLLFLSWRSVTKEGLASLRADVRDLRRETREDFAGLRAEMREDLGGVRSEIGGVRFEIREMGERIARLEVRHPAARRGNGAPARRPDAWQGGEHAVS